MFCGKVLNYSILRLIDWIEKFYRCSAEGEKKKKTNVIEVKGGNIYPKETFAREFSTRFLIFFFYDRDLWSNNLKYYERRSEIERGFVVLISVVFTYRTTLVFLESRDKEHRSNKETYKTSAVLSMHSEEVENPLYKQTFF